MGKVHEQSACAKYMCTVHVQSTSAPSMCKVHVHNDDDDGGDGDDGDDDDMMRKKNRRGGGEEEHKRASERACITGFGRSGRRRRGGGAKQLRSLTVLLVKLCDELRRQLMELPALHPAAAADRPVLQVIQGFAPGSIVLAASRTP